jgi:hypothetical protein
LFAHAETSLPERIAVACGHLYDLHPNVYQRRVLKNLLLIFFGILLGTLGAGILGFTVDYFYPILPRSASFDSVSELHQAMLQRGEQDVDETGSVSLRSIVIPHPDEEIIFDLAPNLDVRFQRARTKTNSSGLRSPEIRFKNPPDIRIAVLGDSFAFGWGVEEEQAFPRVLERYLAHLFAPLEVEVINLGVPGYSTFQEVALFEERILALQPDIALVFFIENDFGMPFFLNDLSGSGAIAPVQQVVRRFWITEEPEELAKRDRLNELADPSRALLHLEQLGIQNGFLPLVAINPRPQWREDYGRLWAFPQSEGVLRHIGLRRGFMSLFNSRGVEAEKLSLDFDPHPSALKHQWLAELLAGELFTVIAEYLLCEECQTL